MNASRRLRCGATSLLIRRSLPRTFLLPTVLALLAARHAAAAFLRGPAGEDEMGFEWVQKFGLKGKGGKGLSTKFSAARGGGGGGGSPFGLGLAKTLYDANKNNAFASTELRTEDTEQGGKIFGAPSGLPLEAKETALTGLVPSRDVATVQKLAPMEEIKEFATTAKIAPPPDTEDPPRPVRTTLLGSPVTSYAEGAGQYIPITMTAPEFKK